MNSKETLRLNGYAVTAEGHIDAHPGAPVRTGVVDPAPRFEQLRVAVVALEITKGSKDAAAQLVDGIMAGADLTPRALVGRKRDGSAVLLFRLDKNFPIVPDREYGQGVFKLASKDGEVRFTLTIKSVGASIDVSAWNWIKGRSPLEIERDRLPILTIDVSNIVVDTALALGTSASEIERQRKDAEYRAALMARVANGEIESDAERQVREDAELVAANEGKDWGIWDGNFALMIINARKRVAARLKFKAA